jgi:hypothetical protein
MDLKGCNIFIISNEPWGKIWYSKHHYANALAKENTVQFINPAAGYNPFSGIILNKINENLTTVTYKNIIPFSGRLDILNKWNDRLIIRKLMKKLEARENNIFWSFDPQRLVNTKYVPSFKTIYHIMDSYRSLREKKFIKDVNLVLTVSQEFKNNFKHLNSNLHFLPHAVPETNLTVDQILNLELKKMFFLVGNINYRIDLSLLVNIAQTYPSYKLNIGGPINTCNFSDEDRENLRILNSLDNVIWLGELNYEAISKYIKEARICLAAYKTDYFYNRYNSLKMMQYLSFAKPIVCSLFTAYQEHRDLIYMSQDNNNFIDLINTALEDNAISRAMIEKRLAFAAEFSLKNTINKIEEIIQ